MRLFGWLRKPLTKEWHPMPEKTADGWTISFVHGPVKVYRYENNRCVGWRWAYNEMLEHTVKGSAGESWVVYREPTQGELSKAQEPTDSGGMVSRTAS